MSNSYETSTGTGTISRLKETVFDAINRSASLFTSFLGVILVVIAILIELTSVLSGTSAALLFVYGIGFILLGLVCFGITQYIRLR